MTTDVTLPTSTGDMLVAEIDPSVDSNTAVIVVHEAFGLNTHIRNVAAKMAEAGHLVLAPDFFHLLENSEASYDDLESALNLMIGITDENIISDIDACIKYLGEKNIASSSIGIVGFCMGGRIAFLASLNREFGAGVTFYGGGIVTENITGAPPLTSQAKNIKSPWLGLFGDLDGMIPSEGVEELREELKAANVPNEIVRYPDADHGFHCNERPESYNADVSADAWKRTLAWFETHLNKS